MTRPPPHPKAPFPEPLEQFEQELLQPPTRGRPRNAIAGDSRSWRRRSASWPKRWRCSRRPRNSAASSRVAESQDTAPPRSGSARTASSDRSAGEAWGKYTRPSRNRSAGAWRSRPCGATATSANLLHRFDRERRTLARLHHTNIVPIYATGSEGDLLYFAMPYLVRGIARPGDQDGPLARARPATAWPARRSRSWFTRRTRGVSRPRTSRRRSGTGRHPACRRLTVHDATPSHAWPGTPHSLEGLHPHRGPGDGHGGRGAAPRP